MSMDRDIKNMYLDGSFGSPNHRAQSPGCIKQATLKNMCTPDGNQVFLGISSVNP
jgi:hypothetical protein